MSTGAYTSPFSAELVGVGEGGAGGLSQPTRHFLSLHSTFAFHTQTPGDTVALQLTIEGVGVIAQVSVEAALFHVSVGSNFFFFFFSMCGGFLSTDSYFGYICFQQEKKNSCRSSHRQKLMS